MVSKVAYSTSHVQNPYMCLLVLIVYTFSPPCYGDYSLYMSLICFAFLQAKISQIGSLSSLPAEERKRSYSWPPTPGHLGKHPVHITWVGKDCCTLLQKDHREDFHVMLISKQVVDFFEQGLPRQKTINSLSHQ